MNEELAMQHSVQNQLQPEPKRNPWPKRILVVFVVLVLVGGIGYGVASAWRQYSNVQESLKSEQAKNEELKKKNESLQSQISTESETPEAVEVSEALPNGKTITYTLTADTSQVLFWNQDGMIALSDKRAISFIASVGETMRKAVCGNSDASFDQTDFGMGILDADKKEFVKNQAANCLDLLASPTKNTDKSIQPAAKAVLDKANETLTQFVESATIQ